MLPMHLTYPATRHSDHVDDYHGHEVPDPYRWLEDDHDPDVMDWVAAQRDFTSEILGSLPHREAIREHLRAAFTRPKYGVPKRGGDRLFYTYNPGDADQPALYMRADDGSEQVLFDPAAQSADGTVALVQFTPSRDGKLLLYSLAEKGTDWETFYVMDVDTQQLRPDRIERTKFGNAVWNHDNTGFFYTGFQADSEDSADDNQQVRLPVFFHRLGTAHAADTLMFDDPDLPGSIVRAMPPAQPSRVYVEVSAGTYDSNRLAVVPTADPAPQGYLFGDADAMYIFIDEIDGRTYVHTSKNAPNQCIIAVDPENPTDQQVIVAETDDVIAKVIHAGSHLVVVYMQHAHHVIKLFTTAGDYVRDIALPGLGSIGIDNEIYGDPDSPLVYFNFVSFLQPDTLLVYDIDANSLQPAFSNNPRHYNDDYQIRQVFSTSKDGTQIPLFVIARQDVDLNGDNPTLLYGYGGFNVSLMPWFSPTFIPWLQAGGVVAVATLRGGGEYGEDWHQAGMLNNKQNVFDDFICAAEYLIAQGWTRPERLVIQGHSNGGLLVAAVMLQRPELFGAVLCHVPVIDMLRYQHFAAGRYWTGEYGDANADEDQFSTQMAYSPLHNVKPDTTYPPLLILTADHDDRVVPMHSFKFAATMQAAPGNPNIAVLRVETSAGHGAGTPISKMIATSEDAYAFVFAQFGMSFDAEL